MTFPVVAATNTSITNPENNTHTVSLPASIQSGDLLIVLGLFDNQNGATPSTPAGWSVTQATTTSGNVGFVAYHKTASGSEGASVTISTGASDSIAAHESFRITGWTGTPQVATATGTGASPDCPNLAPSWGTKDTLWIAAAGSAVGTALTGTPTNYGNGLDSVSNDPAADATIRTTRREFRSESDNPGAYGGGTGGWIGFTIAIEPLVDVVEQRTFQGNMMHAAGYRFRTRFLATG